MFKPIFYSLVLPLAIALVGCSDNNEVINMEKNGPKPTMDLHITPQDGLVYGEKVNVSGLMTDERNLEQYVITITNSAGDTLVRKQQSLLGQSFNVNTDLLVSLPKNAKTENLKLRVRLDNSRNGEAVEEFDINNVSAPTFDQLYLFLSTGEVYPLTKNGDEFSVADDIFFPAIQEPPRFIVPVHLNYTIHTRPLFVPYIIYKFFGEQNYFAQNQKTI